MTLISAIVLLTNNELLQLKCYNSTINKLQQLIIIYVYTNIKTPYLERNSLNSNIIILAAGFQSAVVFSSSIFKNNFKFLQQQFEILHVCAKTKQSRLQNIRFVAELNWISLPLTTL